MRPLSGILALLLLLGAGCGGANRDALIKEVLAADPEFELVLSRHQELANRAQTYRQELALKRSTIERNIAELRKELADAASNARLKTAELKRRLEPDAQRLELALAMATEKQRATRAQAAALKRSVAQLQNALSSSGTTWTPAERSQKDAQLNELQHDADRLAQELAAIRQHVRLLRIKLVLIQL